MGRDILIGGATGIGMALLPQAANTLVAILVPSPIALGNSVFWIARLCSSCMNSIFLSFLVIFLVFVFRLITRSDVAAAATLVAAATLPTFAGVEGLWILLPFMLVFYSLSMVILMRFGLLSFVVAQFFNEVLNTAPITLRTSAWYSGAGFATLAVLAAITLYGFPRLAGQPSSPRHRRSGRLNDQWK